MSVGEKSLKKNWEQADHLRPAMRGRRLDMEIMSAGNVAASIRDMGDLLKNIASSRDGMERKLLNLTVTEMVSQPGVGENIDVSA